MRPKPADTRCNTISDVSARLDDDGGTKREADDLGLTAQSIVVAWAAAPSIDVPSFRADLDRTLDSALWTDGRLRRDSLTEPPPAELE